MRHTRICPSRVARCNWAPKSGAAPLVNHSDNRFAIDCRGYSLAELYLAKPLLPACRFRRHFFAQSIQIKEDEVVFKSWTGVRHHIIRPTTRQNREVLGA